MKNKILRKLVRCDVLTNKELMKKQALLFLVSIILGSLFVICYSKGIVSEASSVPWLLSAFSDFYVDVGRGYKMIWLLGFLLVVFILAKYKKEHSIKESVAKAMGFFFNKLMGFLSVMSGLALIMLVAKFFGVDFITLEISEFVELIIAAVAITHTSTWMVHEGSNELASEA